MQTESEMPTGENAVDKGKLKISVTSEITAYPVEDALISISYTGVPENTLEEVRTDRSGMTESVELCRISGCVRSFRRHRNRSL